MVEKKELIREIIYVIVLIALIFIWAYPMGFSAAQTNLRDECYSYTSANCVCTEHNDNLNDEFLNVGGGLNNTKDKEH